MPASPAPGSTNSAAVVHGVSPREAAQRAIIYRRTRERPRERGLRLLGLLGTLVVHLLVLFGMVLGSAYDLEPSKNPPMEALQVRLIDKPEPPPPPPVRGTPPKQRGPLHRARVSTTRPLPTTAAHSAKPAAKSPQTQGLSATQTPASITPAPAAAPRASLPKPQPSPTLAPVLLSGEPPQITLATPPTTSPVPPRFQPEPVRKPQLEGNRPLPTPPSLAMPELPAQSPPAIAPPSVSLERQLSVSKAGPASMPLARPLPILPSSPTMEPIPLPTPQAPTINLSSAAITPAPSIPREQPQVQAAAIALDQPQLAVIPSTDQPAPIQQAAPALDIHVSVPPEIPPTLAQPLSAPEPPPATAATKTSTPADRAPAETPPLTAAAAEADAAADRAMATLSPEADVSTAPDASPQGSDAAAPGQPNDTSQPAADQASAPFAPAPTHGAGKQGVGESGTPQPGAEHGPIQGRAPGQNNGQLGSYVQLRPHGDTTIMSHGTPEIGYKPTRFAQDWTPEGESSIDTALRHAVEKTTVKHVFHLPRGVRVKCSVSPLLPIALFRCNGADPPPKLVGEKIYERLDLAPAKPLAEPPPTPVRPAATPAIQLDNSAACAAARVSGGPPPPDCATSATNPTPRSAPAPGSSASWVPPSDQFH